MKEFTVEEKLALVEKIRHPLEAVGLLWEFSSDDIGFALGIDVWHPSFDKSAGTTWVRFEDVESGKETAKTILEDVIIELRHEARESALPW
jgi:hypothetical protein